MADSRPAPLTIPDALITRCAARAHAIHPGGEEALVRAITEVSRIYTRSRDDIADFGGTPWALAARLAFFLPRDLLKVTVPLMALSRMGAFPGDGGTLRVLDLGAGLGGSCLGVAAYAAQTGAAARLRIVAVDHDAAALDELARLAADAASLGLVPVEVTKRAMDLRSPSAWEGGPFDLVLLGLALNEDVDAEPQAALLRSLSALLAPRGALVVLEPALRATTRALMRTRDAIAAADGPPYLAYPCPHAGPCPMLARERDWCHQELALALPPPVARLAAAAGLREERLTFASLVLRNEPGHEIASEDDVRRLRLVSAPLRSKGKVEAIGCTERGVLTRLMRLDRHRSEDNAPFDDAVRGEGLALEGLGDEEDTGRLRLGPDLRVHRIHGPRRPA